jgi:hypothetical protein
MHFHHAYMLFASNFDFDFLIEKLVDLFLRRGL